MYIAALFPHSHHLKMYTLSNSKLSVWSSLPKVNKRRTQGGCSPLLLQYTPCYGLHTIKSTSPQTSIHYLIVPFWLTKFISTAILFIMFDIWRNRIILLIIMLISPPIGFLGLVLPALSNYDFSLFAWLPSVLLFLSIIFWLADYGCVIWFLYRWTNHEAF